MPEFDDGGVISSYTYRPFSPDEEAKKFSIFLSLIPSISVLRVKTDGN